MKRTRSAFLIVIVLVAILLLAGGLWYFWRSGNNSGTTPQKGEPVGVSASSTSPTASTSLPEASSSVSDVESAAVLGCDSMVIPRLDPYLSTASSATTFSAQLDSVLSQNPDNMGFVIDQGDIIAMNASSKQLWTYNVSSTLLGIPTDFDQYAYFLARENGEVYLYKLDDSDGQLVEKIDIPNEDGLMSQGALNAWRKCGGNLYFALGEEGGDTFVWWVNRFDPGTDQVTVIKSEQGGK